MADNVQTVNSPQRLPTAPTPHSGSHAGYPLEQIEKAFRLYNLRTYQLPMFDLSNDRIFKYFKRNFPQYKSTRGHLLKLLEEFEEMQKRRNTLTASDKQELINKLYRYIETNKGLTE